MTALLRRRRVALVLLIAGVAALSIATGRPTVGWPSVAAQAVAAPTQTMPVYNKDRALRLPESYRQWIFVGSSLGLSYSEGESGHEMFHETLMEPTAYRDFVRTGTFRDGTMLALILHGTGQQVMPARHGQFAAEIHGVEMAVKDCTRVPEGWAYYAFGGMNGIRSTAQPMPKTSCYSCHLEHGARDNVFLQFYPLLAEAAHIKLTASSSAPVPSGASPAPTPAPTAAATDQASAESKPVALKGLDPVLLVQGREEMGKPEIVASQAGYQYQFVSEPSRVAFVGDPARFAIQNTTCLASPDAPINPGLFAVHEHRIYAFATSDCALAFKRHPSAYVR